MILYGIKLVCPKTQEVYFSSLDKTPRLPPPEMYQKSPLPMLMIELIDAAKTVKLEEYRLFKLGHSSKIA